MAKLLETSQTGKREHLLDAISLIDARKYPMLSMAKKTFVPKNTFVETQADSLPEPSFDGVLDGTDVTTHENMAERRGRFGAYIQIFRRSPMTSLLAEEVSDVAGVGNKKEQARAIVQSLEMLKRDIECAMGSDRDTQPEAKPNPYRMRGFGSWAQNAAQGNQPVPAAYRTPVESICSTASTAAISEADVNAVLESIYDQTGEDKTYTLFCGRKLKKRFGTFMAIQTASTNVMSAIRTFTQSGDSRKIVNAVDFYEGDFGSLELVPSHWLARDSADVNVRNGRGYVCDMAQDISLGWHTAPKRKPLPDLGGGPRDLVYAIVTFLIGNPLGVGAFKPTQA